MKRLVSVFVLAAMTTGASVAAPAVPSHLTPNSRGGHDVTYSYEDKAKTGWYVTARAGLAFLNWTNEYSLTDPALSDAGDDDYSFEPVFEGSISVGRHFDYFWRGELEVGYMGQFSDSADGLEFDLSAPYLMASGYYDFTNGFYLGGGLGMALPMTHLDGASAYYLVTGGDRDKTSVSPMVGLMAGWTKKLDNNLVLDVRYRLAGFGGTTQKIDYVNLDGAFSAENKIGLILDNSFSVGLRYEF